MELKKAKKKPQNKKTKISDSFIFFKNSKIEIKDEQFYCKLHNSFFININNAKRHINEIHLKNNYKQCNFCFAKVKRLYQHKKFCKKQNFRNNSYKDEEHSNVEKNNNDYYSSNISTSKKQADNLEDILTLKKININVPINLSDLCDEISQEFASQIYPKILKYDLFNCFLIGEGTYNSCYFGIFQNYKKPCAIKLAKNINDTKLENEKFF
jgi:hypothetical protein